MFSETEVLKQIQTTVSIGLVLILNCWSNAAASTSASAGTTDSAASASSNNADNAHEGLAPEVLLTISPAKIESETKNQSGHELIEQTAKEDFCGPLSKSGSAEQNPTQQKSQLQMSGGGSSSRQSSTTQTSPARISPQQTSSLKTYPRTKTSFSYLPNAKQQIAQRVPTVSGDLGLSAVSIGLAKQWNIYDRLALLDAAYDKFNATHSTEDTINYLLCKQRVLADVTDVGFDVRRCTNAVDREIAKNASKAAYLTELRDRAIRFNTYADFVAGGLTGIIAGALEMSDLSRFANTSVDISEGVGQATLSAWAFKAEHAGDRRQGGLPNILAAVIDPAYRHEAYPDTVRAFLSTPSPDSSTGMSRVDAMLERWEKLNFCLTHTGHRMRTSKRVKNLTGTHQEDATATIDLLEDRTAMLHDLRAEVTMMDEAVAELFDYVKQH